MRVPQILFLGSFLVLFAFGCSSPKYTRKVRQVKPPDYSKPLPPGKVALERITNPAEIPYFGNGYMERQRLLQAIQRSESFFKKPSSKKYYPYLDITHERAVESLKQFKNILTSASNAEEFHHQIIENFDVYRSVGYNNEGCVFFTGYCEPIYEASREPTAEFRYPLYRLPEDLVKGEEGKPLGRKTAAGDLEPYPTRRQIEEGHLLHGKELVYLKDKFEAYIVHIQGSARLKLRDGSEMRVGYAGKTDRPYKSIAMQLVKDGHIKRSELSLAAIKNFFSRHPELLDKYLYQNESYVFFTETNGGPYGSIGVPVTPYRTIATDKTVFPRGCLAYVETRVPYLAPGIGKIHDRPFRSFALDQDTGGAIRSAGRADLFLGTGPQAEFLAGHTQSEGRLYYLFLRDKSGPIVYMQKQGRKAKVHQVAAVAH